MIPIVMGVVNVTPDSFSDGGRYLAAERAIQHGLQLADAGAQVVDVGGESTRPGATRPLAAEELGRVVPVVRELTAAGVAVSVDTMRAVVAEAAVEAGAVIVNDVSGGLADPDLRRLVAHTGVRAVVQHWRAHGAVMQESDRLVYGDVVDDVCRELGERLDEWRADGVSDEQLIIDPGLGFSKTAAHNWALLQRMERIVALGPPVLVGTSRKAFLGRALAESDGSPRHPVARDTATAVTTALLADKGVWGVRVHDVQASVDALTMWASMRAGHLVRPHGTEVNA
ncbi:dihydropteroate synthase [Arsenicicoccus piscis]|uniref:Dihydropteroate synthase n=1 Tax=Arsenicicoccus piscis TaxID=673954 RepID=A0ABQ6HHQ1_9MICO|nr:dihydropteroate synthase [Arsenicicoccus piscis]MCH8627647.1 dihydropteroate synthase [Arsenicicoccus piscis]GMA18144.1 dihydropteroate synthase [Arsenicicoccus piscis]